MDGTATAKHQETSSLDCFSFSVRCSLSIIKQYSILHSTVYFMTSGKLSNRRITVLHFYSNPTNNKHRLLLVLLTVFTVVDSKGVKTIGEPLFFGHRYSMYLTFQDPTQPSHSIELKASFLFLVVREISHTVNGNSYRSKLSSPFYR